MRPAAGFAQQAAVGATTAGGGVSSSSSLGSTEGGAPAMLKIQQQLSDMLGPYIKQGRVKNEHVVGLTQCIRKIVKEDPSLTRSIRARFECDLEVSSTAGT
jgi:hypothetical protein